MQVRFHPASGFANGHAASILRVIGVSAIQLNEDGTCVADVTDSQLASFSLRAGSHRVERLPDVVEVAPPLVSAETVAAAQAVNAGVVDNSAMADQLCPVPTLKEVLDAGYSPEVAEKIVARQQEIHDLIVAGKTAEAAELAHVALSVAPVPNELKLAIPEPLKPAAAQ